MTKEELEKEAKEYGKKATAWLEDREPLDQRDIENAYLAGAEPREKRIAELEATCNKWFEHLKNREEELLNELYNQNAKYNKQIEELEKENAELKEQLRLAKEMPYSAVKEFAEEKTQDQLTKAKELLKEFVHHYKAKTIYIEDMQDLLEQAEQFLKEIK